MENEFARTELLLGSGGLSRLREASVMVLGVGGVGSHCIEALARSGVGKLILVDHDRVSVTNINRQSIAMHSTVGQYKTKVMKEKIADISPQTEVVTYTVTAKLALAERALAQGIPIISSMGTGNKLHAELFEITDISKTSVCPLCKVMRKELRARGIQHLKVLYSPEKPVRASLASPQKEACRRVPGSVSFVPPVAGLLIAGEVLRELAGI